MTAPKRATAEIEAIKARGVSTRLTLLVALSQLGDALVSDIADASGIGRTLIEQQLEQLTRLACVERAGVRKVPMGRPRLIWRVTAHGTRAIGEPALLVITRHGVPQETPASREAKVQKERYAVTHDAHVKRQRRLGIPEGLIRGDPVNAWGEVTA